MVAESSSTTAVSADSVTGLCSMEASAALVSGRALVASRVCSLQAFTSSFEAWVSFASVIQAQRSTLGAASAPIWSGHTYTASLWYIMES